MKNLFSLSHAMHHLLIGLFSASLWMLAATYYYYAGIIVKREETHCSSIYIIIYLRNKCLVLRKGIILFLIMSSSSTRVGQCPACSFFSCQCAATKESAETKLEDGGVEKLEEEDLKLLLKARGLSVKGSSRALRARLNVWLAGFGAAMERAAEKDRLAEKRTLKEAGEKKKKKTLGEATEKKKRLAEKKRVAEKKRLEKAARENQLEKALVYCRGMDYDSLNRALLQKYMAKDISAKTYKSLLERNKKTRKSECDAAKRKREQASELCITKRRRKDVSLHMNFSAWLEGTITDAAYLPLEHVLDEAERKSEREYWSLRKRMVLAERKAADAKSLQRTATENGRHRGVSTIVKGAFLAVAPGGDEIGAFESEIEAARAHDAKLRQVYGDYAIVNIPVTAKECLRHEAYFCGPGEMDQCVKIVWDMLLRWCSIKNPGQEGGNVGRFKHRCEALLARDVHVRKLNVSSTTLLVPSSSDVWHRWEEKKKKKMKKAETEQVPAINRKTKRLKRPSKKQKEGGKRLGDAITVQQPDGTSVTFVLTARKKSGQLYWQAQMRVMNDGTAK